MKTGITKFVFLLAAIIIGIECAKSQELELKGVSEIFGRYSQEEAVHNAFFRIASSDQSVLLDTVSGQFANGEEVTLNTPFYTASIGKTFTATAIALLVDEGKLSFEDKVETYLDTLVNGLVVVDGVDYSHQLTIHHLLSHTSGLPDYFEDQPISGVNMMQQLFMESNRFWEPLDLIDFAKKHFKAVFKPGEGYHYTDTEYILLGLVVEKVSGMPLHQFFEQQILDPLGLDLTSMNLRSAPTGKPDFHMAELYAGPMEISSLRSLSADWAGGGIRSTGKDLNTFLKTLLSGGLVSEVSLNSMQQWIPESQGTYYGYGLRKWQLNELDPGLPQLTLIGHSGSTGAFMYYCPELDLFLSGTFNNTEFLQKHIVFLAEVLMQIRQNSK